MRVLVESGMKEGSECEEHCETPDDLRIAVYKKYGKSLFGSVKTYFLAVRATLTTVRSVKKHMVEETCSHKVF